MHIHIQAYTPLCNFLLTVLFTEQWGSNEVLYIYLCSSKRTFICRCLNTGFGDRLSLLITFTNILDPDQNFLVLVFTFFSFSKIIGSDTLWLPLPLFICLGLYLHTCKYFVCAGTIVTDCAVHLFCVSKIGFFCTQT